MVSTWVAAVVRAYADAFEIGDQLAARRGAVFPDAQPATSSLTVITPMWATPV